MVEPLRTREAPGARPLSRKRRQTRARLLDAALDAFAERGFHGTSVEEVCERAGFSRSAFYSNYSSKTELFIALYHQQTERVLAALAAHAASTDEPGGHDLGDVATRIVAAGQHDRRWLVINYEFALLALRNEATRATFAAARAKTWTTFAAHLTDVLDRMGLALTVPSIDVARWLFALYEGGVSQAYVEPDRLAPHDLSRQVTPLLLGAVTRPAP